MVFPCLLFLLDLGPYVNLPLALFSQLPTCRVVLSEAVDGCTGEHRYNTIVGVNNSNRVLSELCYTGLN